MKPQTARTLAFIGIPAFIAYFILEALITKPTPTDWFSLLAVIVVGGIVIVIATARMGR